MKSLFHISLLIMFCIGFSPAFASDPDTNVEIDIDDAIDPTFFRESTTRELKKDKKKKGKRNVKIQPSKEDDKNIILELDRT